MNCASFAEELSEEEPSEALRAHLRDCPDCRREREELQRSWELLEAWEPIEPSYQLKARIWEQIRTAPAPGLWERIRNPLRGLSMGLACLALLLVGVHLRPQPAGPSGSGAAAQVRPQPVVASDEEVEELAVNLHLADMETLPDVDPEESERDEDPALPMGSFSQDWLSGAHGALGEVTEDG